MADTINDVMYTALKDAGFDDNVTAMLLNWQRSLDINGWTAYVEHVMANTTAKHFADAEYEFWVNYTGEEPPSFTPADLSPALWIDPSDAATVTISGSSGAYIGPNGLVRGGPNSSAYAVGVPTFTGPVEIEATFTLDSLPAVATVANIVHRGTNLPSLMDWAYGVVIDSNGFLVFRAFMGGSIRVVPATGTAVTTGAKQRWKITADPNVAGDLQVTFYLHDGSSFVQTAQITQTIGTTTFAALGNRGVHVGGYVGVGSGSAVWDGSIARVIIRDGIAGTTIYDADFENATSYVSAFTESALGVPVYVMSSTATSTTVNYGYVGPEGYVGSGATGSSATVANAAYLHSAADVDIAMRVRFVSLTPSTQATIAALGIGSPHREWRIDLTPTGGCQVTVSSDGTTANTVTTTSALPFTAGTWYWLRVYIDVDNGSSAKAITWSYAADQDGVPSSWTTIETKTVGTNGALFSSTTGLVISSNLAGTWPLFQLAHMRVVNDGTTALDMNFRTAADYSASFTESSSNAATVTITATNTPADAAGALVSQINDKSGNARHLTQGTAANMPKYWNGLNGLNCLVFDGTSDYMTGALASSAVDDFGMSAVFAQTVNTNQVAPVHNGTSSNGWGIAAQAAVGFVGWLRGGVAWEASATAYPSTPSTVVLARRSGVAELWKDSTQTNIATATAPLLPTTQTQIGSHSAVGNWFGGRLGEFVVWTAATAQHIVDVRAYEKAKWGTP